MEFIKIRVIESLFSLIKGAMQKMLDYAEHQPDVPIPEGVVANYMKKYVLLAIMWGVCGSMKLSDREKYSKSLIEMNPDVDLPRPAESPIIDFDVRRGKLKLNEIR